MSREILNGQMGVSVRTETGRNDVSEHRLRDVDKRAKTPAGQFGQYAAPSPESFREFIAAQRCPWCNTGPWKVLAIHTRRAHGVSAEQLRELAGLTRGAVICAEDYHNSRSEMRKGQKLPDIAYERIAGKPRKFSEAGKRVQADKARRFHRENPDQTQKASRARVERVRQENAALYADVVKLFDQGTLITDICSQLGASQTLVRGALERAGRALDRSGIQRRRMLLASPAQRRAIASRARAGNDARLARERELLVREFVEAGATYGVVHALAERQGITTKAMVARLRKAGAAVPDGRLEVGRGGLGS